MGLSHSLTARSGLGGGRNALGRGELDEDEASLHTLHVENGLHSVCAIDEDDAI